MASTRSNDNCAKTAISPLLLVIVLLSICWTSPADAKDALRLGYFIFEPHAMVLDNQATGAAIEYFREIIAPEMGIEVQFEGPTPFARLLRDFEDRNFDAIILLASSPERRKRFKFPRAPYGEMQSTLLLNSKYAGGPLTSPQQLCGLRIGYALRAWRTPFMNDPELSLDLVAARYATELNLKKIITERLDGVYNPDYWSLTYATSKHPEAHHLKMVNIPDPKVGYYTVFAPHVPREVVDRYDKALAHAQERIPYSTFLREFIEKLNSN